MIKSLRILILLILFTLAGCSGDDQGVTGSPTIEGYLVKVEDHEILVVSGITKEQAINKSFGDLTEQTDKKYEAHTFKEEHMFESFKQYEVGQRVRVWAKGGSAESYPPQSELEKIEVVE
ncbi:MULTISPECIES: YobA family protein [Pontibacillus]|uniref:YobA family protein n=1 Tax=Pontibacillus chungwhensis TaxID=265426 RepID=A0ABY8V1H3_9BACI|nr:MULTISPECIES: YobA family protein [Pontibacillus]MCD5322191.1 YobA family protein [Pontibacillus sp. HN14]WIF99485.1 YobA family protein [Pontibacillus chungwhensis]